MRRSLIAVAVAMSFSSSASANQPGVVSAQPGAVGSPLGSLGAGNIPFDPPRGGDPIPNMYQGGPKYTPTEWLAKLRRHCASDSAYDKKACSSGLADLKRGHAELKLRRAAASAVSD